MFYLSPNKGQIPASKSTSKFMLRDRKNNSVNIDNIIIHTASVEKSPFKDDSTFACHTVLQFENFTVQTEVPTEDLKELVFDKYGNFCFKNTREKIDPETEDLYFVNNNFYVKRVKEQPVDSNVELAS